MSAIPPNIVGPILQSGLAQRDAARILESERDQQNEATEASSKLRERATESVGEADRDSQVNPDSEGAGSQGRHFDPGEEPTELEPEEPAAPDDGIHRDADGQLHIDLQA